MKVIVDHFASALARLRLENPVEISAIAPAEVGAVVVVEALEIHPTYREVERADGSRVAIEPGDLVAGVLGARQALRGFSGYTPARLQPMDVLHLLNMGGVIGRAYGGHAQLGMPTRVRLVGGVVREGRPVFLRDAAIPPAERLPDGVPIVLVVGSCMNVGKTSALVEVVRRLAREGYRVGGAKATGVAALRDLCAMQRAGAIATASFLDCGVPSTVDCADLRPIVATLATHLAERGADVVAIELGDGVFGHYSVETAFADAALKERTAAVVYAASDLTAAWGGMETLRALGWQISVVCGPVTDGESGVSYVRSKWGLPCANVFRDPEILGRIVIQKVGEWRARRSSAAPATSAGN